MANAPQETIGKYRIIATLGFGSQGAVYRAYDTWLGREFALKVLHPHLAAPDLVERFRREARIIASIPHPNIAGVSEIGEHDGFHCIAIEYVPHSLAELIGRGPLDVNHAASIAYQTALALEAARASENAITHHDVKPDNILLTSLDAGAVVKLIDFGIAHAEGMTSITQAGSQWGTPLYMPPEQWAGERGDTRSDIYSLGVVLYHMLAGRLPFDSDAANNLVKQTEIARQHQQTAAPPLRSIRGDVSEALDAVVAKCMAKQPSARWQTPGELAAALAGMLGQAAPPEASPRPSPQPAPPKLRNRMRLIAAAIFGAVIAIVIAALLMSQSGGSAPDLPPRVAVGALPVNTPTSTSTPEPTSTPPPTSTPKTEPASTPLPTLNPTATRTPEAVEGDGVKKIVSMDRPSIGAGWNHACALREGGSAECWGNNGWGQSDPPDETFVAISAGGHSTCALREDGDVKCWGKTHTFPPPAGPFVAISVGWGNNCGLREDRAAVCWGENVGGQPGPPSGTFVSISAGSHHTCALREDGEVVCWGSNGMGQSDPPAGPFAAISVGETHTCALREDGAAVCWGNNSLGQSTPPAGSFIAISAESQHTCALREDGAAVCWGDNRFGQSDPPTGSFAAISAGEHHTCGLREDGAAVCWGDNGAGQSSPPGGSFKAEAPPLAVNSPPTPHSVHTTYTPLPTETPAPAPASTPTLSEMIQSASPSIVQIITASNTGSGFIISEDGLVVTNAHVVGKFAAVRVMLAEGVRYTARVLGVDETADIAIVDITDPREFQPLALDDSDSVSLGEYVVAMGFPLGESLGDSVTITRGIVSSKRLYDGVSHIQTDAAINPGNSGGPLLNSAGAVVGINTTNIRREGGRVIEGIGFAVAINEVKARLPALSAGGG